MSEEYEVGYGKTPLESRFKPGQSGNPAGRPKGTKNLKTDFLEELQLKIEITEGGKKKLVTKQRAIIKRLINGAMSGETKATETFVKMSQSFDVPLETEDSADLSTEEAELLQAYLDSKREKDDKTQ